MDGGGEEGQGFEGAALAQQDGGGVVAASRFEEADEGMASGDAGCAQGAGHGECDEKIVHSDAASPEQIEWRRRRAGLRQRDAFAVAPD